MKKKQPEFVKLFFENLKSRMDMDTSQQLDLKLKDGTTMKINICNN
jgi:hypothetical protein